LIATSLIEKQNTAIMALIDPKNAVFPWMNDLIRFSSQLLLKTSVSVATLILKTSTFIAVLGRLVFFDE